MVCLKINIEISISVILYCHVVGVAPILVATDVASRGIDIKDIT